MNSISPKLSQVKTSGRNTRTSRKASRPLTPSELESLEEPIYQPLTQPCLSTRDSQLLDEDTAPTHPEELSPEFTCPIFPFPTITQLRDYPNLSVPLQPQHSSVIVSLPRSAPVSPTRPVNVLPGEPKSPSVSSVDFSVILANPSFKPLPPLAPSRSSTPVTEPASPFVGSWDGFFEEPTYGSLNQQFWDSRKIRIVSTDISEPEDLTSFDKSDTVLEFPDKGNLDLSRPTAVSSITTKMSQKELIRSEFKQMELKIDMCSDLDPSLITTQSAPSMDKELRVISEAKDVYRNNVRNFLTSFESELTQSEVEKDKADMENLVKIVNSHKFAILAKVNELNPPTQAMSEFERKSMDMQEKQLELQQKQLELQLKVGDSKKDEMHAVVRCLKKLILEKCTE